jgi:hypothetical protein
MSVASQFQNKLSNIARAEQQLKQAEGGIREQQASLEIEKSQSEEGKDEGMMGIGLAGAPMLKYAGKYGKKFALRGVNKNAKRIIDDWKNKANPADISDADIDGMSDTDLQDAVNGVKTRISSLSPETQSSVSRNVRSIKPTTNDLDGFKTQFKTSQKLVSQAEMKDPDYRSAIRANEVSDLNAESARLVNPSASTTGAFTGGVNSTTGVGGVSRTGANVGAGDVMDGMSKVMEKPAQSALDYLGKNGLDVPDGFKGLDLADGMTKKAFGITADDLIKDQAGKIATKLGISDALGAIGGRIGGLVASGLEMASPLLDIFGFVSGIEAIQKTATTDKNIMEASSQLKTEASNLTSAPVFSMGSMAMPTMDTSTMRSGGMMNF